MTKTLDDNSSAALPGRLNLSRRKYAQYFNRSNWSVTLGSSLPWSARNWPVVGQYVQHWTYTREHLLHGCLNPAMVISKEKSLLAVYTSLSYTEGEVYPVIKIDRERLDLLDPARVFDGAKFAASSLYGRSEEGEAEGRWGYFQPIVVDCLVDDDLACEFAMQKLKSLAWQALEIGINQLTSNEVGLHKVEVPYEIAWNAY